MNDDFDDLFSEQPSVSDLNRTEGFNTLALTRFIPPNGLKRQEEINGLPDDLYKKYLEIEVGLNCRFTIEMLRTGVTSICIENPECGDFSMKLIRDDRHVIAAAYIAIYVLGKDDSVLDKNRQFFKDSFDSYLLRNGWLEIKELSWLSGGDVSPQFFRKHNLTQKQMDSVFSYCEAFGLDYKKLTEREDD